MAVYILTRLLNVNQAHLLSVTCSIKSLDLVCMKELERKVSVCMWTADGVGVAMWLLSLPVSGVQVNVVPIIAKADTIARSELNQFKGRVSEGGREGFN